MKARTQASDVSHSSSHNFQGARPRQPLGTGVTVRAAYKAPDDVAALDSHVLAALVAAFGGGATALAFQRAAAEPLHFWLANLLAEADVIRQTLQRHSLFVQQISWPPACGKRRRAKRAARRARIALTAALVHRDDSVSRWRGRPENSHCGLQ